VGEYQIEGLEVPDKLQEEGGGVVVLTLYLSIPILFPTHSSTPYTPFFILQCPRRGRVPAVCICVVLWLSDEQEKGEDLDEWSCLDLSRFNSAYLCQPRSTFHRPLKIIIIFQDTL